MTKTKVVNVMVGAAGSGKSTYINTHKNVTDKVISLDAIRLELFGTLDKAIVNEKEVGKVYRDRLHTYMMDDTVDVIWYDATNTSLKRRAGLYQTLKGLDKNVTVRTIFVLKPLAQILKQNAQREGFARVPEDVVKRMYFYMQPSFIAIDCDEFVIDCDSKLFAEDYVYAKGIWGDKLDDHMSSYHKETISEHTFMALENALQSEKNVSYLTAIAVNHDLGKFITKTQKEGTPYCHYKGHENVGAMYHFVETKGQKPWITKVILCHMMAHQGISDKVKMRYKLSPLELELLDQFQHIDSISRIAE